jgi:hypothetical protein
MPNNLSFLSELSSSSPLITCMKDEINMIIDNMEYGGYFS